MLWFACVLVVVAPMEHTYPLDPISHRLFGFCQMLS